MAELTVDDVEAAARRYCGWHVTPVETEEVTLDGPGGRLLTLPTLRLTAISELTEAGTALDVDADIEWSHRGVIVKTGGGCWTSKFRGITATITHGFDDVPDWEAMIMSCVDRGLSIGGETVGPFTFPDMSVSGSMFAAHEKAVLDLYRLEHRA